MFDLFDIPQPEMGEDEDGQSYIKHHFIEQAAKNVPEMQVTLSLARREKSGQEHVKPVISGMHKLLQPPLFCWHRDGFPSEQNISKYHLTLWLQ